MAHERHIRCGVMAAAIAGITMLSTHEARAHEAREMRAPVSAGLSTRGTQSTYVRVHVAARQTPLPDALAPLVLEALRDSMIAIALAQLGAPYVYGGQTPKSGFDCSGLVRYAMSQVHLSLPRTAALQSRAGLPVESSQLQRGDLVTFGRDSVTHIGIYLGAGRFLHASSVAGRVIVSPLARRPSRLVKPMMSARRLLAASDAT